MLIVELLTLRVPYHEVDLVLDVPNMILKGELPKWQHSLNDDSRFLKEIVERCLLPDHERCSAEDILHIIRTGE